MGFRATLEHLLAGRPLARAQAEALFEDLLAGLLDDAQIGAVLALLQSRGPTIDELLGGAVVMRRHVTRLPDLPPGVPIIDTCGTGGARKSFNVSTASAIVTAAAAQGRVLVAKHGNRGRSGRGSAEVLKALGVNIDASPAVQSLCLRSAGVCFSFAIHHHPAMKHAARARQSLGVPTIFNALGPLTNPAGATRQVMGVYDPELAIKNAHVLAALGCHRAMLVHGRDGTDEISLNAPTLIAHVRGGGVHVEEFDARTLGLSRVSVDEAAVDDLDHAARAFRAVIEGERGPRRDLVLVTAAAALIVADLAADWPAGLDLAARAIDSGAAGRTLDQLIECSRG